MSTSERSPDASAIVFDAMQDAHARGVDALAVDRLCIKYNLIAKLDGTAKGGIAFSVAKELGTPISYVGTGEKVTESGDQQQSRRGNSMTPRAARIGKVFAARLP